MEYTSLTPISRGLVLPSPISPHLACASGNCLDVYNLSSMTLLHTTTTSDPITHISWGSHPTLGTLLSAASAPSNCVVVITAETGKAVLDVHETPLSIAGIHLTMQGILLIFAEHGVCMTVVNVEQSRRIAVVPFVKRKPKVGGVFEVDGSGKFMAVITRKQGVDGVVVLDLSTGKVLLKKRGFEGLGDVAGIHWVEDGGSFVVWGGGTEGYGALCMLSVQGDVLCCGEPCVGSAFRYGMGEIGGNEGWELGIGVIGMNKERNLMGIGGYDGGVRVVNLVDWTEIVRFEHARPEVEEEAPPVIFREERKGDGNDRYFRVLECGEEVGIEKKVRSVEGPKSTKIGVSVVEFSACGGYMASKWDRAGNVVCLWDIKGLRLVSVVILEEDLKGICWSVGKGGEGQLAMVSGGEYVYLWRRSGAAAIKVKPVEKWRKEFWGTKLKWGFDDSALVVADGNSAKAFLVVYPT